MAYKSTIALDFDGVVHPYKTPWQGIDKIPDPPTEATKVAIGMLREKHKVIIFSTRCASAKGIQAISKYLKEHGIEVDGVSREKPKAVLIVDDRAYRFDGNWTALLAFVDNPNNLTPWNRK